MTIAEDKPESAHQFIAKFIEDLDELLRGRQCRARLGRLDRRHTRGLVVHVLTLSDETGGSLDWTDKERTKKTLIRLPAHLCQWASPFRPPTCICRECGTEMNG